MKTITIEGVAYPCYRTMGAFLKFKNITGKEALEIGDAELSMLIVWLYCLTSCASEASGQAMPHTLEEFANRLDSDQFNAWCEDFVAEAAKEADAAKADKPKGAKKKKA